MFMERPYAKPVAARRKGGEDEEGEGGQEWCLEVGPATILYLGPFTPEEVHCLHSVHCKFLYAICMAFSVTQEILPSQTPTIPVHVKRTDQVL